MVIVVFRSRYKAGADLAAYEALAVEMYDLVASQPGFISIESYDAPDGSQVSLECFETDEDVRSGRGHPAHRAAQQRGRDEFYSWYSVDTAEVFRSHEMHLTPSSPDSVPE